MRNEVRNTFTAITRSTRLSSGCAYNRATQGEIPNSSAINPTEAKLCDQNAPASTARSPGFACTCSPAPLLATTRARSEIAEAMAINPTTEAGITRNSNPRMIKPKLRSASTVAKLQAAPRAAPRARLIP